MEEHIDNYHVMTRSKTKRKRNKVLKKVFKKLKVNTKNSRPTIIRRRIRRISKKRVEKNKNSSSSEESSEEELDDNNEYEDDEPYSETPKISTEKKFIKTLGADKVKYIKEEEKRIDQLLKSNIPPKFKILLSRDLDIAVKSIALKKLESLSKIPNDSTEYYKIHDWFNGLMDIPFGHIQPMPIMLDDGKNKIGKYLFNVQKDLNETVYGMEHPKSEIIQYITQCITNPNA